MGPHPSLLSSFFGGCSDAQTHSRTDSAETLGASFSGRIRDFSRRRIRPLATHNPSFVEAWSRPGGCGPDAQLWRAQPSGSCSPGGGSHGRPRLATRTPDLGSRTDPRDARRRSAPGDLAFPADDPSMDSRLRTGAGSGRPASGRVVHPGQPAPSNLADRCVRTHPSGRQDRSLLASDLGRSDRRRLEDGRFPPSAAGLRSTLAPPRQR
jgi:hypothetical protein